MFEMFATVCAKMYFSNNYLTGETASSSHFEEKRAFDHPVTNECASTSIESETSNKDVDFSFCFIDTISVDADNTDALNTWT